LTIPQFIHVLKGEMSLVGPRPALPTEAAQYADHVPFHCGRTPSPH
jgi:lipopolysaccharide/colanic/teichoic acid biosynthesis glycosyltransferase